MANQEQSHKLRAFYLDQSSLACKAGCGFFGNPEWLGYCSICFKQLNSSNNQLYPQQHMPTSTTNRSSTSTLDGDTLEELQYQTWWQQRIPVQQFQNMNISQEQQYYYPSSPSNPNQPSNVSQMTRSTSHIVSPLDSQGTGYDQLWQQNYPKAIPSYAPISEYSTSTSTNPELANTFISPFDKYGEKRRSQYSHTDKRSNVLKLLRRASTFKDKTQLSSDTPSSPQSARNNQSRSTNDDVISTNDQTTSNSNSANTSTASTLNPSSLFSNLTSPTSLVMSGYDTLTNLHNTLLNTAKSSFRGSPSLSNSDNTSVHSASQSEFMHNTSNSRSSVQKLQFLYDVAWIDCLRHTNKFAKEFLIAERQANKTINELSDLVHEFYEQMNDRLENQLIYKGATADQIELLNDNMERILNEHIYQVISARIINEDEDHNMAIQKRIRSLNWITVEHLEIDIDFQHPVVHDLLDKAICQMVEVNSRTSSIDKLECIVQCSKTIFELLQVNPTGRQSVPVSADQFLPVLVFVVIQANPPMLPADMKYLTRFSNPRRLMSGETGYYFTNLCCALEFIEKVSGASLNISEEQFNKYVSGEAVPETKSLFNTYLCDGLRTMCSNIACLDKLRRRNEARLPKIDNLLEQIDVHLETNKARLVDMQKFTESLKKQLKPKVPKYFEELMARDRKAALKLVPSYLRQTIDINLGLECKLVDIEQNEGTTEDSIEQSLMKEWSPEALNSALAAGEAAREQSLPLSPVEQLESDIISSRLPEPMQPLYSDEPLDK